MRLLFISNLFPDTSQPWRGLDNVTLLHAMQAARPAADIRVLCLRPGHGYWLGRPCPLQPRPQDAVLRPIYRWAPYLPRLGGLNDRLFSLALRRGIARLPRDWQPEALLAPWLFPDAAGVARTGALSGVPLVAVAQGSDVHRYLDMPMRRRAILHMARRAHIVTRSDDLRQRLLAAGATGSAVKTVYNGVHTDVFRPGDKAGDRRELNLPAEGKIALFVGNFLPVKGLDLLIRAAAQVKAELGEPFHLVAIGSGPLESELTALADGEGLGQGLFIRVGRKSPEEVAAYMRAADAVCLSSHNEGVPNVVLEAMASGRPLVSTDVGGIGEVTRAVPSAAALVATRSVADYAKALMDMLRRPPDAQALSQAAAPYSWPRCAGAYWEMLDDLRKSS
jgi:glycosyltransferase involved in cell wall biosynthesis